MNSPAALSTESVKRLLADPSPQSRADTAADVAQELSSGRLDEAERRMAAEILGLLARDLEVLVRKAVAEHAKACPFLPRETACRLAADVEEVALPVIRCSSVLTDDDLIAIIQAGRPAKIAAAAGRESLTARVSDCIIDSGQDGAIKVLLGNEGARISEAGYGKVIADFGGERQIQSLLVVRPLLPMSITERLITVIAEDLREELMRRQELPPEIADELIRQGREGALAKSVKAEGRASEARDLAKRLHARKQLTPTLMLRSLCLGDLRFFEAAVAVQAGIPVASARTILGGGGGEGFRRLYGKTGLPEDLRSAFLVAVELVQEVGWEKASVWRPDYSQVMLARLSFELETSLGSEMEAVMASVSRLLERSSDHSAPR